MLSVLILAMKLLKLVSFMMVLLVAVCVDVTTINIFIDAYADIDGIMRLSATFEHLINCNNINNNSNNTKYDDVFTTQFFFVQKSKTTTFQ